MDWCQSSGFGLFPPFDSGFIEEAVWASKRKPAVVKVNHPLSPAPHWNGFGAVKVTKLVHMTRGPSVVNNQYMPIIQHMPIIDDRTLASFIEDVK